MTRRRRRFRARSVCGMGLRLRTRITLGSFPHGPFAGVGPGFGHRARRHPFGGAIHLPRRFSGRRRSCVGSGAKRVLIDMAAGSSGRNTVAGGEIRRSPRGRHRGFATIDRGSKFLVSTGALLVQGLGPGGRYPLFPAGRLFQRRGRGDHATLTPVVGRVSVVLDRHRPCVDVADAGRVDVGDGAVVAVVPPLPIAAVKAPTPVAIAVVDPAVESHPATPISPMEHEGPSVPTPVAGSPEQADDRWLDPGARHPVVAVTAPGPVPGIPQITIRGAFRLVVERQGGRAHRDEDADIRSPGIGRGNAEDETGQWGHQERVAHFRPRRGVAARHGRPRML